LATSYSSLPAISVLISLRYRYPDCISPFFFKRTPTTEIYTLSLHDALPISTQGLHRHRHTGRRQAAGARRRAAAGRDRDQHLGLDRKSTRLNSSHLVISYAVFCLKKKNKGWNSVYVAGWPKYL